MAFLPEYGNNKAKIKTLTRKVRDYYIPVPKGWANKTRDATISAYRSGKLDQFGFNSSYIDVMDVERDDRQKLCDCASDLLEYRFLLYNHMTSFSKQRYYGFLMDTLQRSEAVNKSCIFAELLKIEQFPNLPFVFTTIKDPFKIVLKMRKRNIFKQFRKWLDSLSKADLSLEEIAKEYVDSIVDEKGFFQTNAGKITKLITMAAVGGATGYVWDNAIMGATGAAILSATDPIGFGFDLVDTFLFSQMTKGWTPRLFFDELRKIPLR